MAIRLIRHVWRRTVAGGPRHRVEVASAPSTGRRAAAPAVAPHPWFDRREELLVETGRRVAA